MIHANFILSFGKCESHAPYKQVFDHDTNFWDGAATLPSQPQSIDQAFGLSVTIDDTE